MWSNDPWQSALDRQDAEFQRQRQHFERAQAMNAQNNLSNAFGLFAPSLDPQSVRRAAEDEVMKQLARKPQQQAAAAAEPNPVLLLTGDDE